MKDGDGTRRLSHYVVRKPIPIFRSVLAGSVVNLSLSESCGVLLDHPLSLTAAGHFPRQVIVALKAPSARTAHHAPYLSFA